MSILGTNASETIKGTDDGEVIIAANGNDIVIGGGGDDTIRGGQGNDNLRGDDGDDTIIGGANDDTIRGGKGADELEGSSGEDTFVFYFGADFRGSEDDDVVLDYELGVDAVEMAAPSSYLFDISSVDGDLVVEVATANGVDRGSITFNGLGDLIEGDINDVSVQYLEDLLNNGLVHQMPEYIDIMG